ncbi:peroxidase-like [Amphibalanus amphitrite]|uniref:peroxidase-like n=1 Tax=Amphibalanus amphitrite TaxID=1232801 RepID=UPI001C915E83|nr:peroxidase-like [Amphibalanus amphitrite]
MLKLAVAVVVSLLISVAAASDLCDCQTPFPAGYKSKYCCEDYSSTPRHTYPTYSPPPAHRFTETIAEQNPQLRKQEAHEEPWQETFTAEDFETFPSKKYPTSPGGYAEWMPHHSEPLMVPRHAARRYMTYDEDYRQFLQNVLHFVEHFQRSPNASRPRPPREAAPLPDCDPQRRYRTADGTCNSAEKPLRGAAGQGNTRLVLPPAYQDGIFLPRFLDSAGRRLPGARQISVAVTSSHDIPLPHLTDSVMQWGQFIDHDLALSPEVKPDTPCCRLGRRAPDAHAFCLPITARTTDPVYGPCGKTCIEFVRSVPAWHERQKVLTQVNSRTSYIDADMLYGVSERWTASLREHSGGRLRVGPTKFLLPDPEPELECHSTVKEEPCFRSGDPRVNVQARLAVMHIIWMREHNRIAGRLQEMNPHWDDERLFQESRRIVIAEIQHITYSHWLPIVLGHNYTDTNMMGEQKGPASYSNRYNAETEPTIATEFSSAAFRFGHSLINNHVFLFSDLRKPPFGFTRLRDIFLTPHLIYQGALDFLAKSLVAQAPQKCDLAFASALTGHLFQERGELCGMDLVAMNIQRGRDHGTPTYSTARRWCGLPHLPSFTALTRVMSPEAVVRLAGVYRSVDDIDLYIGGVAEFPVDGGLVGPTFQCLIGNQFFRLRWGDNFFYDLGGESRPWRFSLAQLSELHHSSWSRVLCDTVSGISVIQPDSFRAVTDENRLTACGQLPEVSLEPWREELQQPTGEEGDDEEEVKTEAVESNTLDAAGFLASVGL